MGHLAAGLRSQPQLESIIGTATGVLVLLAKSIAPTLKMGEGGKGWRLAERVGLRLATEIEALFIVGGRKYTREIKGAHECDAERSEGVMLPSPI